MKDLYVVVRKFISDEDGFIVANDDDNSIFTMSEALFIKSELDDLGGTHVEYNIAKLTFLD